MRVLGEAVLTSTHNLCFEQIYEKYQNFYLKTFFFFFGDEIFNLFELACFRYVMQVDDYFQTLLKAPYSPKIDIFFFFFPKKGLINWCMVLIRPLNVASESL